MGNPTSPSLPPAPTVSQNHPCSRPPPSSHDDEQGGLSALPQQPPTQSITFNVNNSIPAGPALAPDTPQGRLGEP